MTFKKMEHKCLISKMFFFLIAAWLGFEQKRVNFNISDRYRRRFFSECLAWALFLTARCWDKVKITMTTKNLSYVTLKVLKDLI